MRDSTTSYARTLKLNTTLIYQKVTLFDNILQCKSTVILWPQEMASLKTVRNISFCCYIDGVNVCMRYNMAEQTHGKYGIMNRACRHGGNSRGAWVGSGLGGPTVNGVVCGSTGSFEIHSEILSGHDRFLLYPFRFIVWPTIETHTLTELYSKTMALSGRNM